MCKDDENTKALALLERIVAQAAVVTYIGA